MLAALGIDGPYWTYFTLTMIILNIEPTVPGTDSSCLYEKGMR